MKKRGKGRYWKTLTEYPELVWLVETGKQGLVRYENIENAWQSTMNGEKGWHLSELHEFFDFIGQVIAPISF